MKMKVKDLRDYLELREISTEMCREKDELVDLILSQHPTGPRRESRTPQVPQSATGAAAQEHSSAPPSPRGIPAPTSADCTSAWTTTEPALWTEAQPQVPPCCSAQHPCARLPSFSLVASRE